MWLRFTLFASMAVLTAPSLSFAQSRLGVTAVKTIYPGETIVGDMVEIVAIEGKNVSLSFEDTGKVIGKIARRTLLAGRAIPPDAIGDPPIVANGSQVQILYFQGGIEILTTGQALNSAAPGAPVRVRNNDSGITIAGVATADGKVRVGE